jgi:hypothetical protein
VRRGGADIDAYAIECEALEALDFFARSLLDGTQIKSIGMVVIVVHAYRYLRLL